MVQAFFRGPMGIMEEERVLTYIQLGKMECQPSEKNVYYKVNRSGVQRQPSTEKHVIPFWDITKHLLSHNLVLQHPGLPLDGGTIIPAMNLHVCLGHHILFHRQFCPPEIPSLPDEGPCPWSCSSSWETVPAYST